MIRARYTDSALLMNDVEDDAAALVSDFAGDDGANFPRAAHSARVLVDAYSKRARECARRVRREKQVHLKVRLAGDLVKATVNKELLEWVEGVDAIFSSHKIEAALAIWIDALRELLEMPKAQVREVAA